MKKVTNEILKILENYPHTRNNDSDLFQVLIFSNYKEHVKDGKYLNMAQIKDLPSFDTVSRIRRKIQSEGKFRPTNEIVLKKRNDKRIAMQKVYKKPLVMISGEIEQPNLFEAVGQ